MDFWADVERIASALSTISYFELLAVDPKALDATGSAMVLTDAYHAALRRYHPDRHAVGSTPEQKQALARICARIGEAYRALSTPRTRAEYVESLAAGDNRARTKRATFLETRDPKGEKARKLFASARAMVTAGNPSGARAKLDLALQFEPESAALRSARDELTDDKPAPKKAAGDEAT